MNSTTVRAGCFLFTYSRCRGAVTAVRRFLSYYPIDDTLSNLTDQQIQVRAIIIIIIKSKLKKKKKRIKLDFISNYNIFYY